MNTYYHINNNPGCTWKAGDEVYFGNEYNNMWRTFLEKGAYIKLNGDKRPADQVVKYALNAYARNEPVPVHMKGYHFNPVFTLKEATDCLGQSMRIIRAKEFLDIAIDTGQILDIAGFIKAYERSRTGTHSSAFIFHDTIDTLNL